MSKIIRQGDVMLRKVEHLPEGEQKKVAPLGGRYILAEGEATGHHHSLAATDTVEMVEIGEMRFLVAKEDAVLTHQEHAAHVIDAGAWEVVRQREYTPQAVRRVWD